MYNTITAPHLLLELLSQAGQVGAILARDEKMVGAGLAGAASLGAGSAAVLTYARVLSLNLLRPQALQAVWRAGAHDRDAKLCILAPRLMPLSTDIDCGGADTRLQLDQGCREDAGKVCTHANVVQK